MDQWLFVIGAVAGALAYLGYRAWRKARRGASGCGCGTAGCGAKAPPRSSRPDPARAPD